MHAAHLMERVPEARFADLDRRIDNLMRVRALSGALSATRERHFNDAIRSARAGAASASPAARIAASSLLDIASLELCDE